tara:strand:- start:667 stop:900 length:234 start_codon:yes stop_codon:yes gene_type:complete
MSDQIKNFSSGKDWWYMDRKQAIQLLDVVTEAYNKKLSEELWYDDHDVALKMYEIKDDLMRFPDIIFRNAGIKIEKD